MFKELREAWKITRIMKMDGYTGPYVVLRETMMEEMQNVYGWALAENKNYARAFEAILDGQPICTFCEDCKECRNHDKWLEGRCKEFMLKFPSTDEQNNAFAGAYTACDQRCHEEEYDGN